MDRRRFLLTSLAGAVAAPLGAEGQQAGALIGFLWTTRPEDQQYLREAFQQGLAQHGWIKGQNITIEYRWAAGKVERFDALAAELVGLKVQVIVVASSLGLQAATTTTKTIPIIMVYSGDPVRDGFVANLARPGGNITGLTTLPGPEIGGKLLQLLRELVPGGSRVSALVNPTNTAHALLIRDLRGAAGSLGAQLQVLDVRSANELDSAFEAMTRERTRALLVLHDGAFLALRGQIVSLAAKRRIPAVYSYREFVDAGGLMSYGPNIADIFRRVAPYVDKILKGTKPGDLPIEQPTQFEFVINLKTAKALGLTIPPSLLARADQVIE
jgi:putative tryptophan/tyrosine transport system substrate-binding protein